jgi:hypothetical protein
LTTGKDLRHVVVVSLLDGNADTVGLFRVPTKTSVLFFFTLIFPPTHAKSRETNITPLIKQHVVDLKKKIQKNLEQGKDYASFKSEKFLAKLAEHR